MLQITTVEIPGLGCDELVVFKRARGRQQQGRAAFVVTDTGKADEVPGVGHVQQDQQFSRVDAGGGEIPACS